MVYYYIVSTHTLVYTKQVYSKNNYQVLIPFKMKFNVEGAFPFDLGFEPKDLKEVKHSISTVNAGVTEKTTISLPVYPLGGSN